MLQLEDLQTCSVREVAEILGETEEATLARIHRGDLPASNLNTKPDAQRPRWRVLRSDVGQLLIKTRLQHVESPKRSKAKPVAKDYFA